MINSKLKEKYLSIYTEKSLSKETIKDIENSLEIVLPNDLIEISQYCDRFDNIGILDLFSFDKTADDWSIFEKTKFFRTSINLSNEYLVLKEGDESFIVLETQLNPNEQAQVIWCSSTDAYNLAIKQPLIDNPIIFSTFADFFSYLLDQEEEQRRNEAAEK